MSGSESSTLVTVALLQFGTTLDPQANASRALNALEALGHEYDNLDLVCLPEMFTFRALGPAAPPDYALPRGSELEIKLADWAARNRTFLVAGSFLIRGPDGDVYNTSLVFDRHGRELGAYRKTHLFDAPGHSESTWVRPGSNLAVFDCDFGKVGIAICYELRFPEVARQLALAGSTLLVVPNSWPVDGVNMGDAQLTVLLRATALQNLCYIVHCNQFGRVAELDLCGNSCIVDPKGEVIARASDREEALVRTIDLDYVNVVRRQRTTFAHRRPELYSAEAVVNLSGEEQVTSTGRI
jgi:predicted amidohydrolase